jgi:hypothetical protein
MSNDQKVEPRNVSLYPQHWAAVNGYAIAMTDRNISAALRRIIDEWQHLRNNRLVDPPVPYTVAPAPAAAHATHLHSHPDAEDRT